MLSSRVLDVAVGLVLLYGLLSAASSTFIELLASVLAWRANDLEAGIRVLLGAPKTWDASFWARIRWFFLGGGFAEKGSSPFVANMLGHRLVGGAVPTRRDKPSYVSAQNFALALFDVATGQSPVNLQSIREAVAKPNDAMPDVVRKALQPLVDSADSFDAARTNVEHWFDAQMDRLSGLYKRRTQAWLLASGLGIAFALNLDTFEIARTLATDSAVAAAVVTAAQSASAAQRAPASSSVPAASASAAAPASSATLAASTPSRDEGLKKTEDEYAQFTKQVREMTSSGFAVGWDRVEACKPGDAACYRAFWLRILGILVTALTTVMGASTWFSALGQLLALRSSVKPAKSS